MSEIRYMISDASKKIDVEPHVLRYWEDELNLDIPRNEMGHRYYREQDIKLIKTIKILKEQGFQLKAIKIILPDINKLEDIENMDSQRILRLKEETNEKVENLDTDEVKISEEDGTSIDDKNHLKDSEDSTDLMEQQDETGLMDDAGLDKMGQFKVIMSNLILDALKDNNVDLSATVSHTVSESVIKEMDYLMRMKEEREEERYKRLDETIRGYQKSRHEIAATAMKDKKRKKSIFHK